VPTLNPSYESARPERLVVGIGPLKAKTRVRILLMG
jgi:hypothetical protein